MIVFLTVIQKIECWVDKYANWNTFFGFVIGVIALILTIYFYKKQKEFAKQKEEVDASLQRETLELQNKALALEKEKLKNEVKPLLYIDGIYTNKQERIVNLTYGNSNPKGYLHIMNLKSITDGWQLITKHISDLSYNSIEEISLKYDSDKNCEIFDLSFDAEDLYHNKYTLQIHSTNNSSTNIVLSELEA